MADGVGDALQDYVNEQIPGGGMLTQFFSIGSYIDDEGNTCWVICQQEDQTLRESLGLILWAKMDIEYRINEYLKDAYGDGD